ncbi:MAG: radical SAM protein [Oscillospiraceae bacterium]|nr:radical SAM protein [Oscillospiraceae bacterium]
MAQQDPLMQSQLRRYFYQKAAATALPISGTFELTPRCNMNCRMCYIRMSESELKQRGRERTANEWIELGKACVDRGMLFLLLTGGEPFLRADFREIYTELKKLGLMISINTNATLIDEATVRWLSEDAPAKVSVTLYGGSNDTYRRLCGHPSGFGAATRAVDMLKEAGILVHINSSYTRYNAEDMESIVTFARSRGLQVSAATYMFPPVRSSRDGVCDEAARFTAEEAGIARARFEILTADSELLKKRLHSLHHGCAESAPSEDECERTADEKMGCMAGRASFWVTWDGRMTPCGMMNQPVAYPFETGFEAAWQSIIGQTGKLTLPSACSNCSMRKACTVCGALCAAETGSTSTKPDYLCRQTKSYLNEMENAYQQICGG